MGLDDDAGTPLMGSEGIPALRLVEELDLGGVRDAAWKLVEFH